MVKIEELKNLLELKESDAAKMSVEQLRLLLGVLRYSTRIIQRELNIREESIVSKKVKSSSA